MYILINIFYMFAAFKWGDWKNLETLLSDNTLLHHWGFFI